MALIDAHQDPIQPEEPEDHSNPAGEPGAPNQLSRSTLRVIPWRDPLVDSLGLDPRSWYVEQFWLPIVGPTCTWFLRRAATRFERSEPGFVLDLDETARALGLGGRQGRHSPFARALSRCITFELARWQGPGTLAVRRTLPPLARRHVLRLPLPLQEDHLRWTATARHRVSSPSFEQHRDRARRLALGLVALGETFDGAETQLLRWGVHPSLTNEAVTWARQVHLPGSLASDPRRGGPGPAGSEPACP